jgi:predicted metal-dependent RNase
MPRSIDWKIGERRRINRDPEYRTLTIEGVRELLATRDEEDRRVAHSIARGLLELEFDTDVELLEQLQQPISA